MPVTYGDFSAFINGNNVVLNWNTITEINNKEFVVEVSDNGIDGWKKIGVVQSKANDGNSNARIDYSATLPLAGADVLAALSLLAIAFVPSMIAAGVALVLAATMYACNKTDVNENSNNGKKVYVRLSQVNKDGTSVVLGIKEAVKK